MRNLGATIATVFTASALASGTMSPVPKGASEVGHVVLTPGVAEQDHFFLSEKYPGTTAHEHYERMFRGWRPCYWNQRGWNKFGDATSNVYIHEAVRFWVNPNNDTSVMVGLRYTSPGLQPRSEPESSRQFVVLVRHIVANAEKHLAELEAKCEKAS